jgi:hypothetical protein
MVSMVSKMRYDRSVLKGPLPDSPDQYASIRGDVLALARTRDTQPSTIGSDPEQLARELMPA